MRALSGAPALLAALIWSAAAAAPPPVQVAVAANFIGAMRDLGTGFEAATGDPVRVSIGSTGKLYAQIRNGAPFDVFLSADARRPRLLEQQGEAVPGTRFTYALGRLVLWSRAAGLVDAHGQVLRRGSFRHLAIANPRVAPYGAAARQVLQGLGLWRRLEPRLVRGENIAQAYQFVANGSAELGFVALSEIPAAGSARAGSRWVVPGRLYDPIRQQAVLLKRAADSRPARAFLAYLRDPEGRRIIRDHGYALPPRPAKRVLDAPGSPRR